MVRKKNPSLTATSNIIFSRINLSRKEKYNWKKKFDSIRFIATKYLRSTQSFGYSSHFILSAKLMAIMRFIRISITNIIPVKASKLNSTRIQITGKVGMRCACCNNCASRYIIRSRAPVVIAFPLLKSSLSRVFDDRSSRELWESLNVMIDCARPARKKPNVLLASASTHLRPRLPFVSSPPPRHPTFARTTGSDPIPDVHPPILPLASSHPHYVRRRYRLHLVESPPHPISQNVITSLTHELRSEVTLGAARESTALLLFYLKSPTHRLISLSIVSIFLQNKISSRYWLTNIIITTT